MTLRKSPLWILARRELSMMLNAPATYVIFVIFLLITGWFFGSSFFQYNQSTLDTFLSPLPLILTFLVPALTMRSFSEELKSGTLEYLATLPLREVDIVLGKYLAILGLFGLLLAFTLVYPLVLFLVGRPDPGQLVGSYAAVLGLTAFFAAIGVWASTLTRNQVVAFIISFFVCFVFFLLGRLSEYCPGFLAGSVRWLGIDAHFEALGRGVLDLRDLFYWASGAFFFLYAALTALQSRHWK